jgi:gas vesicle protein
MTPIEPYLISAVVGFLAALIALPIQTKNANTKALKTLEEVYGDIIETMKKEIADLKKDVSDLVPLKCEKKDCESRIPSQKTTK